MQTSSYETRAICAKLLIRARRGGSSDESQHLSMIFPFEFRVFKHPTRIPRGRYGVPSARHPLTPKRGSTVPSPCNYAKTFERISAGNSAAREDASVVLGFRAANKGQGGAPSWVEPRRVATRCRIALHLTADAEARSWPTNGGGRSGDARWGSLAWRTARNSWTNRTIRLSLGGTISLEFIPETLDHSYTVRNSYDALARARPRIKGLDISVSRYADERNADLRGFIPGVVFLRLRASNIRANSKSNAHEKLFIKIISQSVLIFL